MLAIPATRLVDYIFTSMYKLMYKMEEGTRRRVRNEGRSRSGRRLKIDLVQ